MAYKNNVKIGFVGASYPAPASIEDRFEKLKWQMAEAYRLGCGAFPGVPMWATEDQMKEYVELMNKYGFSGVGQMTRSVFELAGPDKNRAEEDLCKTLEFTKNVLGAKVLKNGYGRLCAAYTRWNKTPGMTGAEQMARLTESLKLAAPIIKSYDLYYGLENHLDFKGWEFDKMFSEINCPNIGSCYDTANAFYVNCDPNDDIPYLSKWAVTTHIKDTKIIDSPFNGPDGPMIAVGCAVGEGNVDIRGAINAILENSPVRDGLQLILEEGWFGKQVADEYEGKMDEYYRMKCEQGIEFIKDCVRL